MKIKRFELKSITIEISCRQIVNGFAFTPFHVYKFNTNNHKYFCINIELIKIAISIDFLWKNKK